jgi:multidrug resistance protein, MATE family
MDLRLQTGYKQILGMAMPIALSMLVPQINFITNNIFLSGLGEQELASAGITGVYYLIFAVTGNGLNNGLQALISRRAGQNLPKEIGRLFFHGVWLALAFAVLGILITYLVSPLLMKSVLHNEAIAKQVTEFMLIRIWGLPFLYLYVMRNALLVGTNNTRLLVWGTLSEAVVNIVLDYGFIYGKLGLPELGFNGAAYASIIAEATGLFVIYAIIHFKKFNHQFSIFEQAKIDFSVIKLILNYSSPLIGQYTISIASWEFFYILIEHHGERALAVSNAMRNIIGMFGIFSWAFAATSNTMVSNILGQERQEEVLPLVRRIAWTSFAFSFVIFCVLTIKPEWFLSFYGRGPEFVEYAIPVMRVVALALPLMAFSTVWLNAVTGTGHTTINLAIETLTLVVYCIYIYVILEYYRLPITWGWLSEWLYWLLIFILSFSYLRSGRWKGKKF